MEEKYGRHSLDNVYQNAGNFRGQSRYDSQPNQLFRENTIIKRSTLPEAELTDHKQKCFSSLLHSSHVAEQLLSSNETKTKGQSEFTDLREVLNKKKNSRNSNENQECDLRDLINIKAECLNLPDLRDVLNNKKTGFSEDDLSFVSSKSLQTYESESKIALKLNSPTKCDNDDYEKYINLLGNTSGTIINKTDCNEMSSMANKSPHVMESCMLDAIHCVSVLHSDLIITNDNVLIQHAPDNPKDSQSTNQEITLGSISNAVIETVKENCSSANIANDLSLDNSIDEKLYGETIDLPVGPSVASSCSTRIDSSNAPETITSSNAGYKASVSSSITCHNVNRITYSNEDVIIPGLDLIYNQDNSPEVVTPLNCSHVRTWAEFRDQWQGLSQRKSAHSTDCEVRKTEDEIQGDAQVTSSNDAVAYNVPFDAERIDEFAPQTHSHIKSSSTCPVFPSTEYCRSNQPQTNWSHKAENLPRNFQSSPDLETVQQYKDDFRFYQSPQFHQQGSSFYRNLNTNLMKYRRAQFAGSNIRESPNTWTSSTSTMPNQPYGISPTKIAKKINQVSSTESMKSPKDSKTRSIPETKISVIEPKIHPKILPCPLLPKHKLYPACEPTSKRRTPTVLKSAMKKKPSELLQVVHDNAAKERVEEFNIPKITSAAPNMKSPNTTDVYVRHTKEAFVKLSGDVMFRSEELSLKTVCEQSVTNAPQLTFDESSVIDSTVNSDSGNYFNSQTDKDIETLTDGGSASYCVSSDLTSQDILPTVADTSSTPTLSPNATIISETASSLNESELVSQVSTMQPKKVRTSIFDIKQIQGAQKECEKICTSTQDSQGHEPNMNLEMSKEETIPKRLAGRSSKQCTPPPQSATQLGKSVSDVFTEMNVKLVCLISEQGSNAQEVLQFSAERAKHMFVMDGFKSLALMELYRVLVNQQMQLGPKHFDCLITESYIESCMKQATNNFKIF